MLSRLRTHVITIKTHVITFKTNVIAFKAHVITINTQVITIKTHVITINTHVITIKTNINFILFVKALCFFHKLYNLLIIIIIANYENESLNGDGNQCRIYLQAWQADAWYLKIYKDVLSSWHCHWTFTLSKQHFNDFPCKVTLHVLSPYIHID